VKLETYLTEADLERELRRDVLRGLASMPKTLPPRWFYDATGSELFELITKLPEYYPTRAEREILATHARDIARMTAAQTLVELGSGSSDKTRLLLDELTRHRSLSRFVPLDVSESMLELAAEAIDADYPDLEVHAIVGDFLIHLDRIPGASGRLVAFLGGTIGNLMPAERLTFLGRLRATLNRGEWLLLGTDLTKHVPTLIAAYDDSEGVTAEFNRNILAVLNRRLGADFDLDAFSHVAVWNAAEEWIEMRLRANDDLSAAIPALGIRVAFAAGEEMLTEVSAKFRPERVATELAACGFASRAWWTDKGARFGVTLAQAI